MASQPDGVVYDKAKYHYGGDYPDDLPDEQAFVHTGLYLGWIIDRDLYSEEIREGTADLIAAFKAREVTGPEVYESWDGCLIDTMLSAEGNAFSQDYFDFERGKVVNVATRFGVNGVISIYEHAPAARERHVVGSWRTDRVPYVHTFGLTPRHALLVAQPFAVRPVKMLWSSKGYIDHFEWKPEEGTKLVVIDRTNGEVREHVTEAFFVFHTVNAFEREDATVLDLLAYPNVDIMASLRPDRMLARLPELTPSLLRISMRPGVERATVEKLSDCGFEFPSIHYKRVSGRPYRFAYGASDGHQDGGAYTSAIVKVDLETGRSTSFSDPALIFGEPLFVARPQGDSEDDGVLLSVGSAKNSETSLLAVIDARTLALVASAEVPSSIPLGFHGSFLREAAPS